MIYFFFLLEATVTQLAADGCFFAAAGAGAGAGAAVLEGGFEGEDEEGGLAFSEVNDVALF